MFTSSHIRNGLHDTAVLVPFHTFLSLFLVHEPILRFLLVFIVKFWSINLPFIFLLFVTRLLPFRQTLKKESWLAVIQMGFFKRETFICVHQVLPDV